VILAGDFNTWNPQRLGHFLDVAAVAGLHEASMERRCRLAHLNQHLDHVFYRGLKLRSVASLSHFQSSDHAPITATFERVREN
jgi:endonuclease/exonuclease/phosphatase (EEP) superfamily protein YafD